MFLHSLNSPILKQHLSTSLNFIFFRLSNLFHRIIKPDLKDFFFKQRTNTYLFQFSNALLSLPKILFKVMKQKFLIGKTIIIPMSYVFKYLWFIKISFNVVKASKFIFNVYRCKTCRGLRREICKWYASKHNVLSF